VRNPSEHSIIFINHLRALWAIPTFSSALIVIGVEANTGNEAFQHEVYLINAGLSERTCMLHERRNGQAIGMWTDNSSKENMAFQTELDLVGEGRLWVARNIVSYTHAADPEALVNLMQVQLGVYARRVEVRRDGREVVTYTGKHMGQDDCAIVFQLRALAHPAFCGFAGRVRYADARGKVGLSSS
jgi:hypothetical protein